MISVPGKPCSVCADFKSLEEFYRRQDSEDGLRSNCKDCHRAVSRASRDRNPEKARARCAERYSRVKHDFNAARRASRAVMTDAERATESAAKAAYYAANKEHIRDSANRRNAAPESRASKAEYNAAYYAENAGQMRAYARKYARENSEARRAASAEWYTKNAAAVAERGAAYRATRKTEISAYQAAYRAINPGANKLALAKRKERMSLVLVIIPTAEQLSAKWAYWGNACWMCGGEPSAADHVKPLAAGGPHVLANLRPACKPCNSRKHAKWSGPSGLGQFIRT